jgi:hypothetical protein
VQAIPTGQVLRVGAQHAAPWCESSGSFLNVLSDRLSHTKPIDFRLDWLMGIASLNPSYVSEIIIF